MSDDDQPGGGSVENNGPDAVPLDDPPHAVPIEAELDLHPFQPRDIVSVVSEYIEAAAQAGFREVRLVHGRGRGVQRGIVQAALDRHPLVEAFWDDTASHLGATVARLRAQREKP
jgi:dsDNA-specific endonuclease/ATPase MutS2